MKVVVQTKEMHKYVVENNIEYYISFGFRLPYYLELPNTHYEMIFPPNIYEYLDNKERRVIVQISNKMYENQAVKIRHPYFCTVGGDHETVFSFIASEILFNIECFETEVQLIQEMINSKDESDHDKINDICQASYSFFINRYNETKAGNRYIHPTLHDASHIQFIIRKGQENLGVIISPSFLKDNYQHKELEFDKILSKKPCIWLDFLNESKYAYHIFDYRKSIIYASLAIESYINMLIDDIGEDNQKYQINNEGYFINLKDKVMLLKKDGILNTTLSNRKLKDIIHTITTPRNDIVHGRIEKIINLRIEANKVHEYIGILERDFLSADYI